MPVLENSRHERFAQEIARGRRLSEAYADVGYRPDPGNAWRLRNNVRVAGRIAEIQSRAAARAEVTLAGVTEKLLAIAGAGEALGGAAGLAVARAALMDVAKLNGLVVERSAQVQVRLEDLLGELDRVSGAGPPA